jgi:hypothetical protein
MTGTNHSGGECCGGAAKAAQSEPRHPPAKPNGGNGCGCGDLKGTALEVSAPEPVAAEKADGGCCGGK